MTLDSRRYTYSDYGALPQGALVSFELPYAIGNELKGPQKGIVISRTPANRNSNRVNICPLLCGTSEANQLFGIPLVAAGQIAAYLRPDLITVAGYDHCDVKPCVRDADGRAAVLPSKTIKQAIQRYIDIVSPTDEKLSRRGEGFLAYGEVGWFDEFPSSDTGYKSRAPVLCLTPPEMYKVTGVALVTRAFSHGEKFHPYTDVGIPTTRWFVSGFFSSKEIFALSITRLAHRSGKNPIRLDASALKGIAKKGLAYFDDEARAEAVERYTGPVGVLPDFSVASTRYKPNAGLNF